MQQKVNFNGLDVYTIYGQDGVSRASFVPEKGGVGSSLILPFLGKGREVLFQHTHFWERGNPHLPGGLPFVFPICARIERGGVFGNYLYDGHLYNLPIHGFAPHMAWQCEILTRDSLRLTLSDNAETFKQYPFHFTIELEYKIIADRLECRQKYTNTDDTAMPYYAGFHPYFLTLHANEGKADVMLDYAPKRFFAYNEKLTDIIGEKAPFVLPASISDPRINEQLTKLGENKKITLNFPDGFKLQMEALGVDDADMFSYVQIYTIENEPFICVEPWMSFPNSLNAVLGVRWLHPGKSESGLLRLGVLSPS